MKLSPQVEKWVKEYLIRRSQKGTKDKRYYQRHKAEIQRKKRQRPR